MRLIIYQYSWVAVEELTYRHTLLENIGLMNHVVKNKTSKWSTAVEFLAGLKLYQTVIYLCCCTLSWLG